MSRAALLMDGEEALWNQFLGVSDAQLPPVPREIFGGACILITGAGGSIGSAVARALAECSPKRLVLVDSSEQSLYRLQQQLTPTPGDAARYLLGGVTDDAFVREIYTVHAPQIVFHAAAVKHVPLAELNPITAAHTNILGTECVLRHAVGSGTRNVIHLSTDKAVEPVSVLGATKRLAELLVLRRHSAATVTAVRLPNVLGSSGSVAPLFLEQAARQQPLTVTDRNVTRFFLSLQQTVSALLHAAALGIHGILIPEVGPPRRILDLANFLHAARQQDGGARDLPVHVTGLRPGDKLHEQLLSATERAAPLPGSNLSQVTDTAKIPEPQVLDEILTEVGQAVSSRHRDRLFRTLRRAIPECTLAESKPVAPATCESRA